VWAGDGGEAGSKGLAEAPTRGLLAAYSRQHCCFEQWGPYLAQCVCV